MSTNPLLVPPNPFVVGDLFAYLLPRLGDPAQRHVPQWPQDVFGLMSALVQRSGAYNKALEKWPPLRWNIPSSQGYAEWCSDLGKAWKRSSFREAPPPDFVKDIWNLFVKNAWEISIREFGEHPIYAHDSLLLLALADEASAG